MKHPTIHRNAVCVIALAGGLSLAMSAKATLPTADLPSFDNLPNFGELGNQLNESQATINGNVGVSENGTLNLPSLSTIQGNVSVANGATFNDLGHVVGTISAGQDLIGEQNTVFTASEALDALPADQIISGDQTSALSYNVPAGQVEVVDLNGGLNLTSQNITLTGDGALVLNLANSSFNLGGTASIVGNAQNVFINYLGSGTVTSQPSDVVEGQVFIPSGSANLDGTWFGAIYGGDNTITMGDKATLNAEPLSTPEPGTLALMSAGSIPFLLLARRRLSSKES